MKEYVWSGFFILVALSAVATCTEEESPAAAAPREPRIFAQYSVTKMTKLKTVTKTGISTCLSTAKKSFSKTVCSGRKKRMSLTDLKFQDEFNGDTDTILDSTIENAAYVREKRSEDGEEIESKLSNGEEGADLERVKRQLTIWSTDYETLTLTSTATISKYTLTVSVFCTTSGAAQSCFF